MVLKIDREDTPKSEKTFKKRFVSGPLVRAGSGGHENHRSSHCTSPQRYRPNGQGVRRMDAAGHLEILKERAQISKPTLIVANKMDIALGEKNYEKLIKEFGQAFVIAASSDAELALRRAEQTGYVEYVPGEEIFKVRIEASLLPSSETHSPTLNNVFSQNGYGRVCSSL